MDTAHAVDPPRIVVPVSPIHDEMMGTLQASPRWDDCEVHIQSRISAHPSVGDSTNAKQAVQHHARLIHAVLHAPHSPMKDINDTAKKAQNQYEAAIRGAVPDVQLQLKSAQTHCDILRMVHLLRHGEVKAASKLSGKPPQGVAFTAKLDYMLLQSATCMLAGNHSEAQRSAEEVASTVPNTPNLQYCLQLQQAVAAVMTATAKIHQAHETAHVWLCTDPVWKDIAKDLEHVQVDGMFPMPVQQHVGVLKLLAGAHRQGPELREAVEALAAQPSETGCALLRAGDTAAPWWALLQMTMAYETAGTFALLLAALQSQPELCSVLCWRDRHGASLLHYAARFGNASHVHALLNAIPRISASCMLLECDRSGRVPLQLAAARRELDDDALTGLLQGWLHELVDEHKLTIAAADGGSGTCSMREWLDHCCVLHMLVGQPANICVPAAQWVLSHGVDVARYDPGTGCSALQAMFGPRMFCEGAALHSGRTDARKVPAAASVSNPPMSDARQAQMLKVLQDSVQLQLAFVCWHLEDSRECLDMLRPQDVVRTWFHEALYKLVDFVGVIASQLRDHAAMFVMPGKRSNWASEQSVWTHLGVLVARSLLPDGGQEFMYLPGHAENFALAMWRAVQACFSRREEEESRAAVKAWLQQDWDPHCPESAAVVEEMQRHVDAAWYDRHTEAAAAAADGTTPASFSQEELELLKHFCKAFVECFLAEGICVMYATKDGVKPASGAASAASGAVAAGTAAAASMAPDAATSVAVTLVGTALATVATYTEHWLSTPLEEAADNFCLHIGVASSLAETLAEVNSAAAWAALRFHAHILRFNDQSKCKHFAEALARCVISYLCSSESHGSPSGLAKAGKAVAGWFWKAVGKPGVTDPGEMKPLRCRIQEAVCTAPDGCGNWDTERFHFALHNGNLSNAMDMRTFLKQVPIVCPDGSAYNDSGTVGDTVLCCVVGDEDERHGRGLEPVAELSDALCVARATAANRSSNLALAHHSREMDVLLATAMTLRQRTFVNAWVNDMFFQGYCRFKAIADGEGIDVTTTGQVAADRVQTAAPAAGGAAATAGKALGAAQMENTIAAVMTGTAIHCVADLIRYCSTRSQRKEAARFMAAFGHATISDAITMLLSAGCALAQRYSQHIEAIDLGSVIKLGEAAALYTSTALLDGQVKANERHSVLSTARAYITGTSKHAREHVRPFLHLVLEALTKHSLKSPAVALQPQSGYIAGTVQLTAFKVFEHSPLLLYGKLYALKTGASADLPATQGGDWPEELSCRSLQCVHHSSGLPLRQAWLAQPAVSPKAMFVAAHDTVWLKLPGRVSDPERAARLLLHLLTPFTGADRALPRGQKERWVIHAIQGHADLSMLPRAHPDSKLFVELADSAQDQSPGEWTMQEHSSSKLTPVAIMPSASLARHVVLRTSKPNIFKTERWLWLPYYHCPASVRWPGPQFALGWVSGPSIVDLVLALAQPRTPQLALPAATAATATPGMPTVDGVAEQAPDPAQPGEAASPVRSYSAWELCLMEAQRAARTANMPMVLMDQQHSSTPRLLHMLYTPTRLLIRREQPNASDSFAEDLQDEPDTPQSAGDEAFSATERFERLQATLASNAHAATQQREQARQAELSAAHDVLELDDLLRRCAGGERIWVTGAAGMGKSTLCSHILQLWGTNRAPFAAIVVVRLAELRRYCESAVPRKPLMEAVWHCSAQATGHGGAEQQWQDWLEHLLDRDQPVLFLADGYDEIAGEAGDWLLDELSELFHQQRVIVTSRPTVIPASCASMTAVHMDGFSAAQIKMYLNQAQRGFAGITLQADKRMQRLSRLGDALPQLQALMQVPVMASMLASLYILNDIGKVELQLQTRAALYDALMQESKRQVLAACQGISHQLLAPATPAEQHIVLQNQLAESFMTVVQLYCLKDLQHGRTLQVHIDKLHALWQEHAPRAVCSALTPEHTEQVLRATALCTLWNRTEAIPACRKYLFHHLSFQEFLAAQALFQELRRNAPARHAKLLCTPCMQQAWVFVVGMCALQQDAARVLYLCRQLLSDDNGIVWSVGIQSLALYCMEELLAHPVEYLEAGDHVEQWRSDLASLLTWVVCCLRALACHSISQTNARAWCAAFVECRHVRQRVLDSTHSSARSFVAAASPALCTMLKLDEWKSSSPEEELPASGEAEPDPEDAGRHKEVAQAAEPISRRAARTAIERGSVSDDAPVGTLVQALRSPQIWLCEFTPEQQLALLKLTDKPYKALRAAIRDAFLPDRYFRDEESRASSTLPKACIQYCMSCQTPLSQCVWPRMYEVAAPILTAHYRASRAVRHRLITEELSGWIPGPTMAALQKQIFAYQFADTASDVWEFCMREPFMAQPFLQPYIGWTTEQCAELLQRILDERYTCRLYRPLLQELWRVAKLNCDRDGARLAMLCNWLRDPGVKPQDEHMVYRQREETMSGRVCHAFATVLGNLSQWINSAFALTANALTLPGIVVRLLTADPVERENLHEYNYLQVQNAPHAILKAGHERNAIVLLIVGRAMGISSSHGVAYSHISCCITRPAWSVAGMPQCILASKSSDTVRIVEGDEWHELDMRSRAARRVKQQMLTHLSEIRNIAVDRWNGVLPLPSQHAEDLLQVESDDMYCMWTESIQAAIAQEQ